MLQRVLAQAECYSWRALERRRPEGAARSTNSPGGRRGVREKLLAAGAAESGRRRCYAEACSVSLRDKAEGSTRAPATRH